MRFLLLDLADQAQIRASADALIAARTPLSILVCNAGIMASAFGRTTDGFEAQFGVNHLGHFALTRRLLPLLRVSLSPGQLRACRCSQHRHTKHNLDASPPLQANAPSRIIVLSSSAPWNFEPTADQDMFYPPLNAALLNFSAAAGPGGVSRRYDPWAVYGYSKFANLLFAKELARRIPPSDGITAYR